MPRPHHDGHRPAEPSAHCTARRTSRQRRYPSRRQHRREVHRRKPQGHLQLLHTTQPTRKKIVKSIAKLLPLLFLAGCAAAGADTEIKPNSVAGLIDNTECELVMHPRSTTNLVLEVRFDYTARSDETKDRKFRISTWISKNHKWSSEKKLNITDSSNMDLGELQAYVVQTKHIVRAGAQATQGHGYKCKVSLR